MAFQLALLLPALVSADDDGDVLDLSANSVESFKSEIGVYDAVLVEFFAP